MSSARRAGFFHINDPDFMANGYDSFPHAMGVGVDYTFNWFYIDAHHIGYQHSCKCPQRAQGVDPYLPPGERESGLQGFIPFSHPAVHLDPAEGWMSSWNNKQAAGSRPMTRVRLRPNVPEQVARSTN